MRYRFHAHLFARPAAVIEGDRIDLRGLRLQILRAPAYDAFFPASFEATLDALLALPRLDAEPDGFFVVAGDHEGRRWQLDGHLFDFDNRLHRVELHGQCPPEALDSVLRCFGWPATPVVFELVSEGVALDETAFRAWASADVVGR